MNQDEMDPTSKAKAAAIRKSGFFCL